MLQAFNHCYKLSGEAKLYGVKEYLADLLENDGKFIVFAHHIDILNNLVEYMKKDKINYIRVDGSVDINER